MNRRVPMINRGLRVEPLQLADGLILDQQETVRQLPVELEAASTLLREG